MSPEQFKKSAAEKFAAGESPRVYSVAATKILGEADAFVFLAGGWRDYTNSPTRVIQNRVVFVPPKNSPVQVQVRPPCRWELQIVEWCHCQMLSEEQAAAKHVHECGHPDQDGALCVRGASNGRVISCATCRFWELPLTGK